MAKFTSGPYHVVERADTFNVMAGRRCLARFQKKVGARQDAGFYAAAPDLCAALRDIVDVHPADHQGDDILRRRLKALEGRGYSREGTRSIVALIAARAALAKADGEGS